MANETPAPEDKPNLLAQLTGNLEALTNKIGTLEARVEEAKKAVEDAKKSGNWTALFFGLIGAIIGGVASIVVSLIAANATLTASKKNFDAAVAAAQKNFDAALAVAQKNLDNAGSIAFDAAIGNQYSQQLQTVKDLVIGIDIAFRDSAVAKSVQKGLSEDLIKLGRFALDDTFKSATPSVVELHDYAARLLGNYSAKKQNWEDYERTERPRIDGLCEKVLAELRAWAKTQK